MKDVAEYFAKYVGSDDVELRKFYDGLEELPTTQRNALWAEYCRRLRKAAGVPPRPAPGRGELLLLLDQE